MISNFSPYNYHKKTIPFGRIIEQKLDREDNALIVKFSDDENKAEEAEVNWQETFSTLVDRSGGVERDDAVIKPNNWAREQVLNLRKQINNHDYNYFVKNHSEISDNEYDLLLEKLQQLENKYPQFLAYDSPTQKIGNNVSQEFKKVQHNTKLYSLGKVYSEQELTDWYNKIITNFPNKKVEFVCELKIDGLTASLTYKNGEFAQGSTRGNGIIGEDVTENLKTIKSIPQKLNNSPSANLNISGEVFMSKEAFAKLKDAKHIRNAASGSLRQLDPKVTEERGLEFFAYRIENSEVSKNQYETLNWLKNNGFKVNPNVKLCTNLQEIKEYINYWQNNKGKLAYGTDGIVIKINDFAQQEALGYTSKHPNWAIAYKYPENRYESQVINIEMKVGRTGKITPVAVIQPVEIDGATISRVNLSNLSEVEKLDLRQGDTIWVQRTGGVIPKITGVDLSKRQKNAQKFDCKTESNEKNLLKQNLKHWANRDCMNITGLGEALISELVDKNLVNNYADLYKLTPNDLVKLEDVEDKKAEKVISSIQKSKNALFANLVYSLGINGVGQDTAIILASKYNSVKELANANEKELVSLNGIGKITAKNIVNYFKNADNLTLLKNLQKSGVKGIDF